MSLNQWAANGWLRPHKTSLKEIADLLAIVDRDLEDAHGDISTDWRFGIFTRPLTALRVTCCEAAS